METKLRQEGNLTKHGLIVILLWVAAPVAWYLMWKDKKYHNWFPHLLWINGAVFGAITLVRASYLLTRGSYASFLVFGALAFALIQIIFGLKVKGKTVEKFIIPMIVAFLIDIGLGYFYVVI